MPKKSPREYKFEIDAFTPDTIPMSRLAEYLSDLAVLMGQEKSVHFARVQPGSTVPIIKVEWEAEPKVRERLRAVKLREAPTEILKVAKAIDDRLAEDNARGTLIDPVGAKVIKFPGRDRAKEMEYGPLTQQGSFQGVPIKVGGENDPVPLHLEDGKDKYIVQVRRAMAKDIAKYLFSAVVRVEGDGRWVRHSDGEWEMLAFYGRTWHLVEDGDIHSNISELRKVPGKWKDLDDPLADLNVMRHGKPQ